MTNLEELRERIFAVRQAIQTESESLSDSKMDSS